MTADQRISDVQNLLLAEVHLRNEGKKGGLDHGYIGARPYLQRVSCEEALVERIETIWQKEGSEAARREVLSLALAISQ